jgi:hypothetical protein
VPLSSTMGKNNCGVAGAFFLDAGISSTHHIASFWRLGESVPETSRVAATVPKPGSIRTESRGVVAAEAASGVLIDSNKASHDSNAKEDVRRLLDPNLAIAAAFKAAGLPVPDLPHASAAAMRDVAPNPIIRAALKAAGLTRN